MITQRGTAAKTFGKLWDIEQPTTVRPPRRENGKSKIQMFYISAFDCLTYTTAINVKGREREKMQ